MADRMAHLREQRDLLARQLDRNVWDDRLAASERLVLAYTNAEIARRIPQQFAGFTVRGVHDGR